MRLGAALFAAVWLVLPGTMAAAPIQPNSTDGPSLRVMTFNVLHDSVRTLVAPWRVRRPLVVATIRASGADIACLQEVSPRQLRDLTLDLTEYDVFQGEASGGSWLRGWAKAATGLARFFLGDFFDQGERCPILVRKGLGAVEESESFWLWRPSPEASSDPSTTPHIMNWVRVRLPSNLRLNVYNTHLGLVRGGRTSESLALRSVLDQRWNGEIQILAGDFNALPSGSLIRSLTSNGQGRAPAFQDSWGAGGAKGRGGTFHWGLGLPGPRLDYVLVRPAQPVASVEVVGRRVGRTLPSDHYAVLATLRVEPHRFTP